MTASVGTVVNGSTNAVSGTGTISIDVTNLDGGNAINVQFMRTTLA